MFNTRLFLLAAIFVAASGTDNNAAGAAAALRKAADVNKPSSAGAVNDNDEGSELLLRNLGTVPIVDARHYTVPRREDPDKITPRREQALDLLTEERKLRRNRRKFNKMVGRKTYSIKVSEGGDQFRRVNVKKRNRMKVDSAQFLFREIKLFLSGVATANELKTVSIKYDPVYGYPTEAMWEYVSNWRADESGGGEEYFPDANYEAKLLRMKAAAARCPSRRASTCQECLDQEGCGAWSTGMCFKHCRAKAVPMDVPCYGKFGRTAMCPEGPGRTNTQCPTGARGSCRECLAQGCGAWSGGTCLSDCQADTIPSDVLCYGKGAGSDNDLESGCTRLEKETADFDICNAKNDCSSCVGTKLSGGNSTCSWFPEKGECRNACRGFEFCGPAWDTCARCMFPPERKNCRECFKEEGCGAWSLDGKCYNDCDAAPADASCYSKYRGSSPESACTSADNSAPDAATCSGKTDCSSCVGTMLSDGESTCKWYPQMGDCRHECSGLQDCGTGIAMCDL